MKTIFLPLITAFILANTQTAFAQVSSYSFSQSVQSYGNPNNGTAIGTVIQDDDVNTVVLPFNFVYNGNTYTNINVCSNGYLSFTPISGSEYQAISDLTTNNLIAPFAQDMITGTVIKGDFTSGSNTVVNVSSIANLSVGDSLMDIFFDFGGVNPMITAINGNTIVLNVNSMNTVSNQDIFFMNGSIRQNVTGTTPNRICEFSFKNMTRFMVYDESINFKVRLYETTNKIEFLYGNIIVGSSSASSEVGLKGQNNSDFNSRSVNSSNTWSTSVASTFISDMCDFTPNSIPDVGLSYLWSPTVCTNPTLNVVSSNPFICAGQTVTLVASGASTYSWSNGSSSANIVVSPTVSTTFTVIGFDGLCNSILTLIQHVTPQPTLNIVQTRTIVCRGEAVTLTASGAGTYSWSTGSNGSFIVVSPTVNTTYTVTGANSGCVVQKTVLQKISSCTNIEDSRARLANMSAFPNPFSSRLNVENPSDTSVKLQLFDLTGNLVYENTIEGGIIHLIDTETLKNGMYVLILDQGEVRITKKVIKN